jgi:hypothetical protein
MAGPFRLAPNEVQSQIPTWALGKETLVIVDCAVDGFFEMRAGGSPPEMTSVKTNRNEFRRNFGGVLLAVKNLTNADITVTTE